MEQDYNTYETLDGENVVPSDIASSSVKETESAVSSDTVETLSLKEINEYLGKNYKDKASALKSIKDTASFVGQRKSDVEKAIDPERFISRDQYETDMFYSKNPEYEQAGIRTMIDSMAKAEGKRPSDVVQSESFKAIFGKVRGYDESQSVKSVLETNPRLTSSRDKFTQAQDAVKSGNKQLAEDLAVRAVMEAYEK